VSTPPATWTVGDISVTSVSDGTLYSNHDVILGIDRAESERLTGVPVGQPLPLDVNCFLLRYHGRHMLIDCGSGHTMGPTLGALPANLRALGIAPETIDTILFTHLHPDHSLGLVDQSGGAVFPNAELIVHEQEASFWLDRKPDPGDSERIQRNTKAQREVTRPYLERLRRVRDGEVMPGLSAVPAPGHTPGHTAWLIESGHERLLVWGDVVHLAAVQMARPDATLIFDVEPDRARATRQRVLEWAAAERLTVAGAHLGFPGFGRVVRSGAGFSYVPAPER